MPTCGQPGFKVEMAFSIPHTMQMSDLSINPCPALCVCAGWKPEPPGFSKDMEMGRMCATSRGYFITRARASVPAKCMKCFALERDAV